MKLVMMTLALVIATGCTTVSGSSAEKKVEAKEVGMNEGRQAQIKEGIW